MITPIQGKVRKIYHWTFPSVQEPKYRVIPTRWGDNQILDKLTPKDNFAAFRIGEYYYWLQVFDNAIKIYSFWRNEYLGKEEFSAEDCNTRYPRWKEATQPTLVRYFGKVKDE